MCLGYLEGGQFKICGLAEKNLSVRENLGVFVRRERVRCASLYVSVCACVCVWCACVVCGRNEGESMRESERVQSLGCCIL